MINKIFIGLFVFLFLVSCGLGGFSFYLNNQINILTDDVNAFKTDTANKFTNVQADISHIQNDITSLDSRLATFQTETNNHLNTIDSNINSLNADLNDLAVQLAESTMNVRQVYNNVIGSVCQIIGSVSEGSGFIYDADGYIVTCWHVVYGQSYLDVKLHDGRTARAKVIGSDRASDVAVLKISGFSNLKPLPLADSNVLVAGEPIIGVGNPRGTFETVVYGIISRTKGLEYVDGVGWVSNLIQFDAATNPGNSGGPVFNNKGQVIGIVESGYTSYYQCTNFAVSSNKIKRVAQAIIEHGSFTNANLPGKWSLSDLTPEVALTRGLSSSFGLMFDSASNIGQIKAKDVIIAIDEITVKDGADLFSYIAEFKSVGDTVKLTIIRGSNTQIEISLTLVKGWIY
jgi:S1-C subfamily serine protease